MEYIAVVDCFRRLDQCSRNIYQVHYPAFAAGKGTGVDFAIADLQTGALPMIICNMATGML